jgi:cytoskeletal protein CcmA (bactofilin family)
MHSKGPPFQKQATPGKESIYFMWNKRDENGTARPQPEPVATPRAMVTTPAPAVGSTRATAVIGASMQMKGEIHTREELVVDGEVEGLLESLSSITIGPNGKVKANIKAREVAIFGSVKGNIEVSEKIAIREKGSLVGDIKTAGISIDDGAYFKGSIDIVRPEPAPRARATVVSEAS